MRIFFFLQFFFQFFKEKRRQLRADGETFPFFSFLGCFFFVFGVVLQFCLGRFLVLSISIRVLLGFTGFLCFRCQKQKVPKKTSTRNAIVAFAVAPTPKKRHPYRRFCVERVRNQEMKKR